MATTPTNTFTGASSVNFLNTPTTTPSYNMGTANVGDGFYGKAKGDLAKFNQSMVTATNTSGTNNTGSASGIYSNYGMNSKVNDIINTHNNQVGTSFPTPQIGGTQNTNTTTSGTGEMTSYGTPFTAPEGAQLQSNGTYLYNGQYYSKDQLGTPENLAAIANTGLQQKKIDEALKIQLDNINRQFDQYKQQQQDLTSSGAASVQNALLQSGAGGRGSVAQYAAATADARVNSIISDGNKKLQDLDNQRQQLLSAAQLAKTDKDFELLGKLNAEISKNVASQIATVKEANMKLAAETKQAKIDQDVADIYSQGDTNPVVIMNKLKEQGKIYSLEQINNVIENAAKNLNSNVKGMGADIQSFWNLKNQKGGLPEEILKLPSVAEQQAAYLQMLNEGRAKGTQEGKNGPKTGLATYEAARDAVINTESGGSYTITSPAFKMDDGLFHKSYGKYQVLDTNIPVWTKEALGYSMTPEEFLANPDAQEKVADAQFKKNWDRYGNIEDVASIWFTGVPYAQAVRENRKDVATGMTVQQYVANVKKDFAKITKDTSKMDYNDPSYTTIIIQNSKGEKEMTGEQSKPIQKAMQAVSQMTDLSDLFNKEVTGPIAGVIRSNNPYDEKARIIKAQIQAILPNLARGVYGEVGVLTDQDIENYAQVLGNLQSLPEVNRVLLSMNKKAAFNSVKTNLETLAAAKRDVSLFEPIYENLRRQIENDLIVVDSYKKGKSADNPLGLNINTNNNANDPLGIK